MIHARQQLTLKRLTSILRQRRVISQLSSVRALYLRSRPGRILRPLLLAAAILPACAAAAPLPSSTETIPGTLVKFAMIRIPAGALTVADPAAPGSTRREKVRSLWIGKTEVTWDEYDVFVYRLDLTEQQKAAGADAVSRPSRPYGAPDRGFGHHGY